MRNSRPFVEPAVAAVVCSLVGVACAETKPPAVPVAAPVASPPGPQADDSAPSKTSSDVHISDEIRSKCGIPDEDAYFTFNSATLTASDRTPLDLVARCFTSGPLSGHAVKLVGRADPRGSSDYNLTLGQWRADAVQGYLTLHGMRKSKASTTSRGSMDATGSDEEGWRHDRRVDVMLGE